MEECSTSLRKLFRACNFGVRFDHWSLQSSGPNTECSHVKIYTKIASDNTGQLKADSKQKRCPKTERDFSFSPVPKI